MATVKVILVGPADVNAAEVGRVIDQFTDADELVTTGALRGLVDVLLKRKPRGRRPKVSIEFLEAGRYGEADAFERLSLRLVYGSPPPHAVVIVGELFGPFVDRLLADADAAARISGRPLPVWSGEDFVRERRSA